MLLVGLTGGIATGKSSVATFFSESGGSVVDLDLLSRKVVEPGLPAWRKIKQSFGDQYFDPDSGQLDRKFLGEAIFGDPEKRRKLNSIIHPYILWQMLTSLFYLMFRGNKIVVVDMPLLFETGASPLFQTVIVVTCDERTQLERLMQRDGLVREEALERIETQIPLKRKCSQADFVVDNSRSLLNTEKQVTAIVTSMKNSNSCYCTFRTFITLILLCCILVVKNILAFL